MSLQQYLLVGRSFAAGSPKEKSPFEMRKDIRLPIFENAPRFAPRTSFAVQTDWLAQKEPLPLPGDPFAPKSSTSKGPARRRQRNWLEILTFGLFGKPRLSGELVQEEMNLENVRVLRNDLADADLEVVVNKKKKFALRKVKATLPEPTPTPKKTEAKKSEPRKREQWSELTARLFEIGQH